MARVLAEDVPSLLAAFLAILAYVAAGRAFWAGLVSQAEAPAEVAFVAGTVVNPVLRWGKCVMIFSWPLWVVVPAIVLAVMDCVAAGHDRH